VDDRAGGSVEWSFWLDLIWYLVIHVR
jgi:hypothetical protein